MEEIRLYDLLKYYVKKWRLIALITFVGLLGGLAFNQFIQVPMYESNAKLILVSQQASQTASNQTLINNYIELMTSRRVLEPVIAKQNNTTTYEDLLGSVRAVNQKDTAIIDVTVSSNNAQRSADIANEITSSFKTSVNDLYKDSGVIVVDPAVAAASPSNVKTAIQLAVSAIAGLILGVIVLFFVYDYIQTKSQIRKKSSKQLRSDKLTVVTAPVVTRIRKANAVSAKNKPVGKSRK